MARNNGGRMKAFIALSTYTMIGSGVLAGIRCSPDSPLPDILDPHNTDCSTVNLTYENFGKGFFQNYCLRCHSVALTQDFPDRIDAPQGINFDTLDMAREFRKRIRLRAGELGDMPPLLLLGPRPSEEERVQLINWIDCGMATETPPTPPGPPLRKGGDGGGEGPKGI